MAKANEKYEAMVVFSTKQGEDAIKALVEKFSDSSLLTSGASVFWPTRSAMRPKATMCCTTLTAFLPSPWSLKDG